MTDEVAKKTRVKQTGARAHVVTVDGKDWLLTLENCRVASAADLNRALDGNLPRASLSAAATGGGGPKLG